MIVGLPLSSWESIPSIGDEIAAYNIDGIFTQEQDSLKYYGTEVLSCQFGIYLQIRDDKKLCDKRKVSRATELTEQNTLEEFFV